METISSSKTLAKVGPDEPIFVLRAQDRCAPGAIRDWARQAKALGASEEKVQGAMDDAVEVEAWQRVHGCKTPD